ncbi:uncharacterized protein [Halyomorpha halys]|uniref:uncharacterized protein isoform X2 n=1 Tax=Halyomorpha halys TaxID=286706 RepID=UPI000D0C76AE|nr:uncharacterized protein LOC106687129 isoform X2 [Halyomorpha halys]
MALADRGFLDYNGHSIEYIIHDNKLSLNGKDVATILEFEHPLSITSLLDTEDCYRCEGEDSDFIYESGIYILSSKSKNKEKARSFKIWAEQEIKKMRHEEKEEIRRYSLRLEKKSIESKLKKKEQRIYISSSSNYARQHIFKIGGVGSEDLLAARLSNYNSRSVKGDEWKYYLVLPVSDFKQFENRFWDLLSGFRLKRGKEMIQMEYNNLKEVFSFIAENYNAEIDFLNERLQIFIRNINNSRKRPTSPVPIEIGTARESKVKKSYIILPDYEELKNEIKKCMNDKKFISKIPSANERKQVIEHCTKKFKKFSKREAWKIMKEISEERNKVGFGHLWRQWGFNVQRLPSSTK